VRNQRRVRAVHRFRPKRLLSLWRSRLGRSDCNLWDTTLASRA
jgi:hypothetical protein